LISVRLSAPFTANVTVSYAVTGGTATSGLDYTLIPGTLTFAPGETVKNISLTIINDSVVEPDETVIIALSAPTNATLGSIVTHTYTILNDDVSSSTAVLGRVMWNQQEPVADALVELVNYTGLIYFRNCSGRTGADGRFRLTDCLGGTWGVWVTGPSTYTGRYFFKELPIPSSGEIDVGVMNLPKKLDLLEPPDVSFGVGTTPTLRWNGYPGASRYRVSVSNSTTFAVAMSAETTASFIEVTPALQIGGWYYWAVQAYAAGGIEIARSASWTFRVGF
jgi:hypothetical protein